MEKTKRARELFWQAKYDAANLLSGVVFDGLHTGIMRQGISAYFDPRHVNKARPENLISGLGMEA